MAKNNKVKFGLNNVHYAKILNWTEDKQQQPYLAVR